MTHGMIDIHEHIVYGVDDGPRTREQTEELLASANSQGVIRIIATPHVWPGKHPFDYNGFLNKLNELNHWMWQQKWPLRLLPGAEIYYTPHAVRMLNAKEIPTLAMSRHVLVEFSPAVKQDDLFRAMRDLINGGYHPILAHVERYQCLHNQWALIQELRALDVQLQMNAQTVLNSNGLGGKQFIRRLLEENAVDFVATDAHNATSRPLCLEKAHAFLCRHYGQEKADALTWQNQLLLTPALDPALR